MGRPTLTTERLRLVPLAEEHAPFVVAMNADPEVMRFISGEAFPPERTMRSFPHWVADQEGLGFWAGFVADEFVGVWGLIREGEEAGVAEIAYRLPQTAWGRGLATEGSLALLDHGFGAAGLTRVWSETMTVNVASRRVMEHLGMTYERSHPGEAPTEGWEQGEVVLGIDRATWAARRAAETWDAEAPAFDEPADHGLRDPAVRAAWRDLLLDVLPSAPARVADLGCGTGTLSLLLAEEGFDVEGVDVSPAMIELALAKRGDAERPTFRVGDAAAPDLDGRFDVVLCRHVLWALPNPVSALLRWADLLGDGGRLVLVEGLWSNGAGLSAAETLALLARAGRTGAVRPLPDAAYWGREITDERYVVVS
ncbi:MAG: bifunctional GNAT family N-acetyltransferase/class I SAM-dependent methyltransferase [Nocardioidaceae bacterium]